MASSTLPSSEGSNEPSIGVSGMTAFSLADQRDHCCTGVKESSSHSLQLNPQSRHPLATDPFQEQGLLTAVTPTSFEPKHLLAVSASPPPPILHLFSLGLCSLVSQNSMQVLWNKTAPLKNTYFLSQSRVRNEQEYTFFNMQSTAQANEETEVCATSRVLQSCARTPSDTSAILTPGNAGEPLLRAQHRRQHTSEVHLPFHQSYGNSRAGSRGHVQHNNPMDRFCSPQHPTRLHSAGCSSLLLLLRPLVRLAISTPNTDVFPSLRTPLHSTW